MTDILIEFGLALLDILVFLAPTISWVISAGIMALIIIQLVLWWAIVGDLVRGTADREDALMLLPLYWIIPFVALLMREVPKALKRPVRN